MADIKHSTPPHPPQHHGVKERVTFPLPKGLSKLQIAGNASQPNA